MSDLVSDIKPYVFVSYSSADRERVLQIGEALDSAGITLWIDQHRIEGGSSWSLRIAEAIEGCAVFVLMSSSASLASRNVRQEIILAWKHSKPYLPILLDPTAFPKDIEYFLEGSQWVEALDHPPETWLPKVMQALVRLRLGNDLPPAPAPTAPARSPRRFAVPSPLTPILGRQAEIEAVRLLVIQHRLVTLVGPGGTGKTRLAIAVADALRSHFDDGVVFVDLAPVRDVARIIPTIATTLDIHDDGRAPLATVLSRMLAEQHLLLVLDNWEQVVEGSSQLAPLLAACPHLRILATSRVPLHLRGEYQHALAPLPTPDVDGDADIELLGANAAVALFQERARAVRPGFELTPENASAIADICRRVDGLPLAIELAAARMKMLSPIHVLGRLEHSLDILGGGARDLPERQQTIRNVIQWSYDLLEPAEQRLVRRLSIFVNGWTFEAAEAIVDSHAETGIDVFDGLASLVDQSLVLQHEQPDGESRFSMLATIHEFFREQLNASGEQPAVEASHITYFTRLVEEMALMSRGRSHETQFDALERDHDNLRAALRRGIATDSETALRLAAALWPFWDRRGFQREGREWLIRALATVESPPSLARAMALIGIGGLSRQMGSIEEARSALDDAIELLQEDDESSALSNAIHIRGVVHFHEGEYEQARTALEESLQLAGPGTRPASTLNALGAVYHVIGDHDRALLFYDESVDRFTQMQDFASAATVIGNLGELAHDQGDVDLARTPYRRSIDMSRTHRHARSTAYVTRMLGRLEFDRGNYHDAWTNLGESTRIRYEMGLMRGVVENLRLLADIALTQERAGIAVQLFGAIEAVRTTEHLMDSPRVAGEEQMVRTLREQLGIDIFEANWIKGMNSSPIELLNEASASN